MRTRFLIVAAIAAMFTSVPPASAAPYPPAHVTLDVSLFHDDVNHAGCALDVPRRVVLGYPNGFANGWDVLDEARSRGCIDSYESVDYGSYGRFLTCIDDICGQDAPTWALPLPVAYVGTVWSFTIDNQRATVGLDTYNAADGDEVGFTYSPYACLDTPFMCVT